MNHFSFATMKVKVRALLYALILAQLLATLCFMGYGLGVAIAGHYDAMQPRSYVYSLRKDRHGVAGLSCADHGGPLDPQITDRMVYWKDVPSDSSYVSPYVSSRIGDSEKYLAFKFSRLTSQAGMRPSLLASSDAEVSWGAGSHVMCVHLVTGEEPTGVSFQE